MKTKAFLIGVVVLLPLISLVLAYDISGKWSAQVPGGQGTVRTVFTFGVDGTKLLGTVSNPQGLTAISEGKINGNEISFVVVRNFDGNEMKLFYRGKVSGDEIDFTSKAEDDGGQSQHFIANREFQGSGNKPARRYVNLP
jgi:hypothetical protein